MTLDFDAIMRGQHQARAAYRTAQQTARALLEDIQRYLDAHQDSVTPEQIHWGYVGDINAIIAALKEVAI